MKYIYNSFVLDTVLTVKGVASYPFHCVLFESKVHLQENRTMVHGITLHTGHSSLILVRTFGLLSCPYFKKTFYVVLINVYVCKRRLWQLVNTKPCRNNLRITKGDHNKPIRYDTIMYCWGLINLYLSTKHSTTTSLPTTKLVATNDFFIDVLRNDVQ